MPYPNLSPDELEHLREIYFPRRSAVERFTDAVLAGWLVGFGWVLGVVGWWILNGGQLPD